MVFTYELQREREERRKKERKKGIGERFGDRKFTSTGAGVITVMVSAALEERVRGGGKRKEKTKMRAKC